MGGLFYFTKIVYEILNVNFNIVLYYDFILLSSKTLDVNFVEHILIVHMI